MFGRRWHVASGLRRSHCECDLIFDHLERVGTILGGHSAAATLAFCREILASALPFLYVAEPHNVLDRRLADAVRVGGRQRYVSPLSTSPAQRVRDALARERSTFGPSEHRMAS
jgi:hypothetical protein